MTQWSRQDKLSMLAFITAFLTAGIAIWQGKLAKDALDLALPPKISVATPAVMFGAQNAGEVTLRLTNLGNSPASSVKVDIATLKGGQSLPNHVSRDYPSIDQGSGETITIPINGSAGDALIYGSLDVVLEVRVSYEFAYANSRTTDCEAYRYYPMPRAFVPTEGCKASY